MSFSGDEIFDELSLIKDFVLTKTHSWNSMNVSSESRWLEIFKYMNVQQRPVKNLSSLVEFAFSLPGTSTDVERLFSIINDVWSPDKSNMSIETLEAILTIKFNLSMNCIDFYKSVQNDKKLLLSAHSSKKYSKD